MKLTWLQLHKPFSILVSLFVNGLLFGQQITNDQYDVIARDFQASPLSLKKRMEHFQLNASGGEYVFLIDGIDPCLYFNGKTKAGVLDWLGQPDSVLYVEGKIDRFFYRLNDVEEGCDMYFSYGIPKPMPKSMPEPMIGQVIAIEFVCVQNCKTPGRKEEIDLEFLKVSFKAE